MTFNTGFYDVE